MSHFQHIQFAASTDVGQKRKNNEDAYGTFPEIGVFCVADGMGGGDDGEVASNATIEAVKQFAASNPLPDDAAYSIRDYTAALSRIINDASKWILDRAKEKGLKGCGSTFVSLCLDASKPDEAVAVHAGDSRLYRIRGRAITQITRDHSAAELMGARSEDEVNPLFRGMILRAVGVQPTVELDVTPFDIQQDDKILICSDGLYRMVPERKITSIIRKAETPGMAVAELIDKANEAGGVDNITAVVVFVGTLPPPAKMVGMAVDALHPVERDTEPGEGENDETDGTEPDSQNSASSMSERTAATGCSLTGSLRSIEPRVNPVPKPHIEIKRELSSLRGRNWSGVRWTVGSIAAAVLAVMAGWYVATKEERETDHVIVEEPHPNMMPVNTNTCDRTDVAITTDVQVASVAHPDRFQGGPNREDDKSAPTPSVTTNRLVHAPDVDRHVVARKKLHAALTNDISKLIVSAPVSNRNERLYEAYRLLTDATNINAEIKCPVLTAQEARSLLGDVEDRRKWIVGEVENRTGFEVVIDGKSIVPGAVQLFEFVDGKIPGNWVASATGYDDKPLARDFNGKRIELKDDDFKPRAVNMSLPQLEEGVVCVCGGSNVVGSIMLRPGDGYSCVYNRAGYESQTCHFNVKFNEDGVLPSPGKWKAMLVGVEIPDLENGVKCKVNGVDAVSGAKMRLAPGTYSLEYSRLGYKTQTLSFVVEPGRSDVLPPPGKWKELPVAITMPMLSDGVKCKIDGQERTSGDQISILPGKHTIRYSMLDHHPQTADFIVQSGERLSLPLQKAWVRLDGLVALEKAEEAIANGQWGKAIELLEKASVESPDAKKRLNEAKAKVDTYRKETAKAAAHEEMEKQKSAAVNALKGVCGDISKFIDAARKCAVNEDEVDVIRKQAAMLCQSKTAQDDWEHAKALIAVLKANSVERKGIRWYVDDWLVGECGGGSESGGRKKQKAKEGYEKLQDALRRLESSKAGSVEEITIVTDIMKNMPDWLNMKKSDMKKR
ncbi:MAG: protein phosphatase 2C domain-containing protein [Kiritimatiellae bacterium]|nr:protein phosphatase 2C domain-containing protein [Kiritimatiellia bacterium]